jgi:hypothetical protein
MAILTASLVGGSAAAGDARHPQPVLVELYTSQGCSDCPRADDILTDLARRNDVIALSFPITYWDILGWTDTLASMANTDRQKAYAEALGRSGTYTPQLIVDGVEDVVGNKRHEVISAITRHYAQRREAEPIDLGAEFVGNDLTIEISGTASPGGSATIWVMPVLDHADVKIDGGENADRVLRYTNVVRDVRRAGSWNGGDATVRLPISLPRGEYDRVAIVVQDGEYGAVRAAVLVRPEN